MVLLARVSLIVFSERTNYCIICIIDEKVREYLRLFGCSRLSRLCETAISNSLILGRMHLLGLSRIGIHGIDDIQVFFFNEQNSSTGLAELKDYGLLVIR